MSKKLITFPCAGGNANNFNKIIKNLDCKIYSMEYSGCMLLWKIVSKVFILK